MRKEFKEAAEYFKIHIKRFWDRRTDVIDDVLYIEKRIEKYDDGEEGYYIPIEKIVLVFNDLIIADYIENDDYLIIHRIYRYESEIIELINFVIDELELPISRVFKEKDNYCYNNDSKIIDFDNDITITNLMKYICWRKYLIKKHIFRY